MQTLKPACLTPRFSCTPLCGAGAGVAFAEFSHGTTSFWRSQSGGKLSSYKWILQYVNRRVEISVLPDVPFLRRTCGDVCFQRSMRGLGSAVIKGSPGWCFLRVLWSKGGVPEGHPGARSISANGNVCQTLERTALWRTSMKMWYHFSPLFCF